ncbi:GNAT family N-acetyltransferase [Streptacidiphilus jiangxiensis]|uniref:Ribosomal protein S18 acetylase RimI n=1 Tax=Streptacidiphilus jiangxiensis TaxID=235985 RepID=A0A1H7SV95_STRJI|nr:GNAT family N-acetyltransferase [Streptacidiphilus jiangxiensis]SEL76239.1 Ribosomal protein S18 acetylase RimI [Streptacidiphilus jiangxiensis]
MDTPQPETPSDDSPVRVVIRPAVAADGHAVYVLDHRCWSPATEVSEQPDPPEPDSSAFYDDRHRPEHMLVAVREGELLGWVRVLPPTPLPSNAHIRAIMGLQVAPEARGLGLGRALLHAALAKARAEGARRVTLRVLGGNIVARSLYEQAGFTVTGVQPQEFWLAGEYADDVLMGIDLDAAEREATGQAADRAP